MFLGRKKELKEIKSQIESSKKTAILVYGKRRVGKTSLIAESVKNYEGIVINHLCVESSYEGNLDLLCRSISFALSMPQLKLNSLFDVFDFLKAQKKKIVLILDEYQYLKKSLKAREFDSYMQVIIDSLPTNVKVILCGSYISVMKELLLESNPLFGRFTLILNIEDFDYLEASQFYKKITDRKKVEFYSVFGGSPFVLSNVDAGKSLEENIEKLLIHPNSILRTHIENVMLREIQKAYDVRIFSLIGNGKRKYSEIASGINKNENGLLDKQLKSLLNMDAISKIFPINKADDKKKQFYEIKDNLMRFYFTFIFGNSAVISKLGDNLFFKAFISEKLDSYISLRFEAIAAQYFSRMTHSGKLTAVIDIGSYWYDDKVNKTNGQFDCVLKMKDGYNFYECKFYKKQMSLSECKAEENQIKVLTEIDCKRIGFICSAGFTFNSTEYELLSLADLYDEKLL